MKNARRIVGAVKNRIKWIFFTGVFYVLRIFPIQKNKVFLMNYYGKGYGDNSKYICKKLLSEKKEIDLVWGVNDLKTEFPDGVRKVKCETLRYIYELCTAKVWVDNCRKPIYVRKRKGQYYIQTWHGDIGPKKVEKDASAILYPSYIKAAMNDSSMADLFVSGNRWCTELYKKSFWYNGEVVKCGYPRRDILYSITSQKVNLIKKELNINSNSRLVLYAPTFRKNQMDLSVYMVDWNSITKELENKFGGEWKVLIRLHPNISSYSDKLILSDNIINVTEYPDMQELMAISDICISDYSSSIFEFVITGKPGFIFAKDYQEYKKEQDVWLNIDELFLPFAQSDEELIVNIKEFDYEKYKKEHRFFYDEIIGMYKEGNASEYLANIISKKCFI